MNEHPANPLAPFRAGPPVAQVPLHLAHRRQVDHFRQMLATLRRRWLPFSLVFVTVMLLVFLYTLKQTPEYTATSTLLVNSRVLNVTPKDKSVVPESNDEDRGVNAEIQVLLSNEVINRIVSSLQKSGYPGILYELTGSEKPSEAAVMGAVRTRTRIDRPGTTNVLAISFTAQSPDVAAAVANGFVTQYLAFKSDMRLGAAREADSTLRNELETMRGKVEQAEAAVADYRRANNLLSASGVTLTEQEQSLYKQQEAAAQTTLAEERARLNTARSQLAHGSLGDDVGEALGSPVIGGLRGQRATASAKLADLQARYKPGHPDVIRAQKELDDIDNAIKTEISRVISNLEARVQVAQQKAGVASGIAGASRAELAANAAASVKLNELERKAEALRSNYAGLLERQTAVSSESVVAEVDARPLSSAIVPTAPSRPNFKLNMAIGVLLALLAAGAVVAIIQIFDRRLVSSRDVEEKLGLPHLVNVPAVQSIVNRSERNASPIDFVLDAQLSMLAEAVRSLLLEIEEDGRPDQTRFVGLTSAQPGEGKSTLAACLARVSAASGRRTLLIDGDVRMPSIADLFDLAPTAGLTEVLSGQVTLQEALIRDERSGTMILPALLEPFEMTQFNWHEPLRQLIAQVRKNFDLVIFDAAPALAATESRLLMEHVDHAIMVVRWNSTQVQTVRSALKRLYSVGVRPTGVVMTRVDMKAIAAYALDDVDHGYRRYAAYGV